MVNFRDSSDITREAMKIVPVSSSEQLIEKLQPYKTASIKLLRELIRAVNVENQYNLLKQSEFNLVKAAEVVREPFDPDKVLEQMDIANTGMVKAAAPRKISFKDMKYTSTKSKKAAGEVVQDIKQIVTALRKENSAESFGKLYELKTVANARYAAAANTYKTAKAEIDLITKDIRKKGYAEVIRWSYLKNNAEIAASEMELAKFVMEI